MLLSPLSHRRCRDLAVRAVEHNCSTHHQSFTVLSALVLLNCTEKLLLRYFL